MKILYVASEAAPFAATGGLGDVIGALPAAVAGECSKIEATVVIPYYAAIKEKYAIDLEHVCDLDFNLAWRKTGASIYRIVNDRVEYLFVENNYYFNRSKLYGEFDDAERFAFFSKAVLEYVLQYNSFPDIIHANDWQTAPLIVYLKTVFNNIPELQAVKTLYTIHNIEYQGIFSPEILGDVFGFSSESLRYLHHNGCINLMKAAIELSDFVSTVSENYATELEYDYFAFGLAEIVKNNRNKFVGIINGIDYEVFSPEHDTEIYKTYNIDSVDIGKKKNKQDLQSALCLEEKSDIPLLAIVSRLTEGKGMDIILHIIEELLKESLQLVILGTGEEKYEKAFSQIENSHCNFKAIMKFDRSLSRKFYAAADILLMPSKSEPCGLSQMIACSYGAVPIVHSIGGLRDSIRPYAAENSNGFGFDNFNAHELLFTVKSALDVYKNHEEWRKLRQRAMQSDFSWRNSAVKYISIYRKLMGNTKTNEK